MATYRKTIANRFFSMAKASSSSRTMTIKKRPNGTTDQGRGGGGGGRFLRRFFFQSAALPTMPEGLYLPTGDKLGVDGLLSLPALPKREWDGRMKEGMNYISVEETKKVLRASQMEAVRARLRGMDRSRVSYSEFVEICCDGAGGFEQGMGVARLLDESGTVIVLGNVVFLRPDQVAKAIESVMPLSITKEREHDPRTNELKAMEEKKAVIDGKAEALVKRELWCGLGLLLLQTTGFMRLTFWELSWDVMEPICFYVTSVYFMAGYAFFLRTSRDPSFEGFFQSRFAAKQKRLMKTHKFDVEKFDELRKALPGSISPINSSSCCSCHQKDKTLLDVCH